MADTKKPVPSGKALKINIPESVQGGKFSNIAQINTTDTEVTFDFAHVPPNSTEGTLVSRVVLTPDHAYKFMEVLTNILTEHEKKKKQKR